MAAAVQEDRRSRGETDAWGGEFLVWIASDVVRPAGWPAPHTCPVRSPRRAWIARKPPSTDPVWHGHRLGDVWANTPIRAGARPAGLPGFVPAA